MDLPIAYCPYGIPGDRLWVREAWELLGGAEGYQGPRYKVRYSATPDAGHTWIRCDRELGTLESRGVKPSIFMPREFSRITLEITDVRVERVQHISAHNAICEGVVPTGYMGDPCDVADTTKDEFRMLWDDINASRGYGWKHNPWVWVVAFEQI
jgi:hypothetical protein